MGAQGTAVLDFGSFPGKLDATVTVTGQGSITTSNLVEAWILPQTATTVHSVDEHIMAQSMIAIVAGKIVNSTGFTITGMVIDTSPGYGGVNGTYGNLPRKTSRIWGTFNIAWVWN